MICHRRLSRHTLLPTPPRWFTVTAVVTLLWNLAGLFAVIADLRLSPSDIAALPAEQQALYAARPLWSVVASVIATVGGTLGCVALLRKRRWALVVLVLSLAGGNTLPHISTHSHRIP